MFFIQEVLALQWGAEEVFDAHIREYLSPLEQSALFVSLLPFTLVPG